MGPFALWIFHFSSPCLLTVFGIYIRAQDVVLEIGTDMLFHVFKEMALKGLQFVSLGPWLNLTGAQSFSWTADLTETKGPKIPSSQFRAIKLLWAPDCVQYPLPHPVNGSGGPDGLNESKTSASG